jgi:hypothetical protein
MASHDLMHMVWWTAGFMFAHLRCEGMCFGLYRFAGRADRSGKNGLR